MIFIVHLPGAMKRNSRRVFMLVTAVLAAGSFLLAFWLTLSAQEVTPARQKPETDPPITIIISGAAAIQNRGVITIVLLQPTPQPETVIEAPHLPPQPCSAPNQALCNIESDFAPLWADLQARQADFYAQHNQYWQGLAIGPGAPIAQGYRPSDLPYDWLDFFGGTFTQTLNYWLTVDVYNSPAGAGYKATIKHGAYQRTYSYGPLFFDLSWGSIITP